MPTTTRAIRLLLWQVLIPLAASAGDAVTTLDDFERLRGWTTTASQGTHAELAQDTGRNGMGLRLDFDFRGGSGYVTLRKTFAIPLPENYAFTYYLRAEAPQNNVEFKLLDPSGDNVWWRRSNDFQFPSEWNQYRIKKRMLEFAWGPAKDVPLKQVGAIEFTITSSTGGRGSVWLDDLRIEKREPITAYDLSPRASASTANDGHAADGVLDQKPETVWHSGTLADNQWLQLDFLKRREFGGLMIDWDRDDYATGYAVQVSQDGNQWQTVYTVTSGDGRRDYIYMPDAESRYLRLDLQKSSRGQGYGINTLTVKPFEFSSSPNRFFEDIAKDAARGLYPRYFNGEQSYFTVVGSNDGAGKEGLLNTDGMLEVDKGAFSIEPFLFIDDKLVTWNDVEPTAELERAYLPIPSVSWRYGSLTLKVTAFAADQPAAPALYARYRVENTGSERIRPTLFLALRPFQVNPPWQSLNMTGGVARIRAFAAEDRAIRIDDSRTLLPLTPPNRFGAVMFDQGSITTSLQSGKVPDQTQLTDPFGHASAALEYRLDLGPGASREIYLAMPFNDERRLRDAVASMGADATGFGRLRLRDSMAYWSARLSRAEFTLPGSAGKIIDSLKSNLAYIFINRDGAALQPGSRTYARTWIRDGAIISSALLGTGYTEEVRQFIRWYAGFQFPDGKIPCCVDQRGPDSLPENDSHGEFIYTVAEYYRYTRDIGFVVEMWPHIVKAVDFIDTQRARRMTETYTDDDRRDYYGLMPESISHEGYASRPVHAYWDDFWTLRGLKDAAYLAGLVTDDASRYQVLRDAFAADLYASLRRTIAGRKLSYIPASVELGDFDPNAVALFVGAIGEGEQLPKAQLQQTFEDCFRFFEKRRAGLIDWSAYTPYEIRVVEAFIRLGQPERAHQLMNYLLADQRPLNWNQWAEVVWRDPKTPMFIGDMPHSWIGAEFIRAVRSFYAYERESDQALVLAAGITGDWVENDGGVAVKHLPTWFGTLSYTLGAESPSLWHLKLSGDLTLPPGKILLKIPPGKILKSVVINGKPASPFSPNEAVIAEFPADVTLSF